MAEPIPQTSSAAAVERRDPSRVMTLERLGAGWPTRLSFARTLVRRMSREGWHIHCERFQVDPRGVGQAAYRIDTPGGTLSFVAFCEHLEPEERTDRVIATRWDATFALVEGAPDDDLIRRLADAVPLQEAGRVSARELVLSRANRSVRLFEHVAGSLAAGGQPDRERLREVGYLMRTTAVYGNGKFGLSDLGRMQAAGVFALPFQAEMFTVYMARHFSIQMVEHVARARGGARAVTLAPELRRALGVGNATGLGMAPFLVTHPRLLDRWITVREEALARARAQPRATSAQVSRFAALLARAREHLVHWHTGDARQSARLRVMREELARFASGPAADPRRLLSRERPFDALFRDLEGRMSVEAEELVVSLIIEVAGPLVDDLENTTGACELETTVPTMSLGTLREWVEREYAWALAIDFAQPSATHLFWYVSENKEEPRLGERGIDHGHDREMRLDVARQVRALHDVLCGLQPGDDARSVAWLLLREPRLRGIVRRIQSLAGHPYAEIRANLVDSKMVAVDLLRCKLAMFGATRFDPKSDRWTRITLFQGAPWADELGDASADDWWLPVMARAGAT